MRLAILSDIHGNIHALEACMADLHNAGGADRIWILGDLVVAGSRPAECMDLIMSLKDTVIISGNTDRWVVQGVRHKKVAKDEAEYAEYQAHILSRDAQINWTMSQLSYTQYDFLRNLRPEVDISLPGYGYAIGFHGRPGDDEGYLNPDTPAEEALDSLLDREGRIAFCGHTHVAMDRNLDLWRVINVGSVGRPADEPNPSYAFLTYDENTKAAPDIALRRFTYDKGAMIADLEARHPQPSFMRDQHA